MGKNKIPQKILDFVLYKLNSLLIGFSSKSVGSWKESLFCLYMVCKSPSQQMWEHIDNITLADDNTANVTETGLSTVDQRNALQMINLEQLHHLPCQLIHNLETHFQLTNVILLSQVFIINFTNTRTWVKHRTCFISKQNKLLEQCEVCPQTKVKYL